MQSLFDSTDQVNLQQIVKIKALNKFQHFNIIGAHNLTYQNEVLDVEYGLIQVSIVYFEDSAKLFADEK